VKINSSNDAQDSKADKIFFKEEALADACESGSDKNLINYMISKTQ